MSTVPEPDEGIVFRDTIMLALLGFVVMVVLLIPYIHPPKEESETQSYYDGLKVEISWPKETDVDIDLWVRGPDGVSVGYSNKGSTIFNLMRDDLGSIGDPSFANHEEAKTRGFNEGEHIINLHYYRSGARVESVPVNVAIYRETKNGRVKLFNTRVYMEYQGQEITVARVDLRTDGYFKKAPSTLPAKVRTKSSSSMGHPGGGPAAR